MSNISMRGNYIFKIMTLCCMENFVYILHTICYLTYNVSIIKCSKIFLGTYVPLTKEGKIIVDGVLASCYAGFDHDLAHFTMSPMQYFSEVLELTFGNDSGYPFYVSAAGRLGIFILTGGIF